MKKGPSSPNSDFLPRFSNFWMFFHKCQNLAIWPRTVENVTGTVEKVEMNSNSTFTFFDLSIES